MHELHRALRTVIWVSSLSASGMLLAEPGPKESAAPPAIARSRMTAVGADTSNTACYFKDGTNITWKWGLTSTNAWYSFSGNWIKTEYTKVEKFKTTVSYNDVYSSCSNSQSYYKVKGNLFAIFAATSNVGSNYTILLGGGDLFPDY
jgi:hypothetical protein